MFIFDSKATVSTVLSLTQTKFLCFPVSKIHRKMELYVLQEFAIWLLLLINIHLFYKTVKKFFLFHAFNLIIQTV